MRRVASAEMKHHSGSTQADKSRTLATSSNTDFRVRFLGGAGTVTGSRFLIEAGGTTILVDCGLYQGIKELRLRNWAKLPFAPESLDAVVLTHAHIDHSGFLPVLVREGFRGPIYATAPTVDLCGILLPDSGHIQEEDAAYANRKGFSKHTPALPLYDEAAARKVLPLLHAVELGKTLTVGSMSITLRRAGHILGAASVEVSFNGETAVFSGDLGQDHDPICEPPESPCRADTIVMESTYGDRRHTRVDPLETLGGLVREIHGSGATLLVPAFAVGRVQSLLFWFDSLFESGRAPRVPIVVDSPMATSVTELYRRHHRYHRLSSQECGRIFGNARFTPKVTDSKALADHTGPLILISASGMMTGGRVLHHFKRLAPDPKNIVLIAGFQAPGTRGAALLSGAESIKMHGGYVPVRARVEYVASFSAHADCDGLLGWLASAQTKPKKVVLVHGEPVAADVLRRSIEERLHLPCVVAQHDQSVPLGKDDG